MSVLRRLTEELDYGCAFPVSDESPIRFCGCQRRFSSSYCEAHHAICYLPLGSYAEGREVLIIGALAGLVGGRVDRGHFSAPTDIFLRRAERVTRAA